MTSNIMVLRKRLRNTVRRTKESSKRKSKLCIQFNNTLSWLERRLLDLEDQIQRFNLQPTTNNQRNDLVLFKVIIIYELKL